MSSVNILIAGIGGQGVLSASRLLAQAVLSTGGHVVVGDAFGASQREGSVVSNVRIGPAAHGPLIGQGMADFLIAFEPFEALRSLPYLASHGAVVVNAHPVIPMGDLLGGTYPPLEEVWQKLGDASDAVYRVEATETASRIAAQYGSHYDITNVVILGAAGLIKGFPVGGDLLEQTLRARFSGTILAMNVEAVAAGQGLMGIRA
jgi:indolepyruvate ferredoxin oxidoreductase beta subunit